MSRKVLLIIDMLNDFMDPKGALFCGSEARRIIPVIKERSERFRAAGYHVLYMQDAHDRDDREFERYPEHAVAGTWGSRIIDALAPGANEPVLPKKTLDSFYKTGLGDLLAGNGVTAVEVVGVCTSICVMDAVGGLVTRGYQVCVPEDAVADFDQEAHAFAIKRMQTVYGAEIQ